MSTDPAAEETTSVSPGLFDFDEDRQLLRCTACRGGVGGTEATIAYHLKTVHGYLPVAERQRLTQHWSGIDALTVNDGDGLLRAQELGYHPGLELFRGGYGCGVGRCLFVGKTRQTIIKHAADDHPDVAEARDAIRPEVAYQMLLYHGTSRYHAVVVPDEERRGQDEADNGDEKDGVTALQGRWDCYEHERRAALATVPSGMDARQLTLWDARTHWPGHFAGQNMRQLVRATVLDRQPGDPANWITDLVPAVLALVKWCHAGVRRCSTHVLRLVRSVDGTLQPKPFRPHLEETVKRDARLWQRLVLFLVRVSEGLVADPGCRLSPGVAEGLKGVRESTAAGEAEQLRGRLLELSHRLIVEGVYDDPLLNPVMHFLAVLGYHEETGTWRTAQEYRPTLSQCVYLVRILALEFVAPQDRRSEGTDTKGAVERYWRSYLHDGSDTFFTEAQSLRCYAKALAGDFYVHPTILWGPDLRRMQYKGDWVDLEGLRDWYHGLLARTTGMLDEELIFTTGERRECHDPACLTDNLTWKVAGDSFCDLAENGLRQGWRQVLAWARTTEKGRRIRTLVVQGGKTVEYQAALLRYRRLVDLYAQNLLLLVQFGCPGCRISELTVTTFANGIGSLRNYFILRGQVAFISGYNKSEAVTERPKMVVRFMAAAVGRLYVAYVAHVLPFLTLLGMVEGDEDWRRRAGQTSFVWHTAGKPWTTDKVSALMAEQTEAAVGVRLGAAAWRNVAIGIDQKLLQSRGSTDEEALANNHALLMGHSEEVENHHYAIPVGMLVGTSEKVFDVFEDASHRWHAFWRLGSASGVVLTTAATGKRGSSGVAGPDKAGFDAVVRQVRLMLEAQTEDIVARLAVERARGWGREGGGQGEHPGKALKLSRDNLEASPTAARHDSTTAPERSPWPKRRRGSTLTGDGGSCGETSSPPVEKRRKADPDSASGLPLPDGPPAPSLEAMLASMLGPGARWRPGQREAIETILGSPADVMVTMPTGAGKSLVVVMTATLARDRVTVVVVPFIALRQDARRRYAALGLQSHVYEAGKADQASVVLATPESVATGHFRQYLASLVSSGRLVRVFIDEGHTLVLDQTFRPDMVAAAKSLTQGGIQRVVMSGTMPAAVVSGLEVMLELGGPTGVYRRVKMTASRPGISYRVVDAPRRTHVAFLRRRITTVREREKKVLVCVMAKARGAQVAQELQVPFYSGDMDGTSREKIMAEFVTGRRPILVATSGAGTGIDIDGLVEVVHLDGSFGMTEQQQQAGRAGRGGERVTSTVLLDAAYEARIHYTKRGTADERTGPEARSAQEEDRAVLATYLQTRGCRRRVLSEYFDGQERSSCREEENACDNCGADAEDEKAVSMTSAGGRSTVDSTPRPAEGSGDMVGDGEGTDPSVVTVTSTPAKRSGDSTLDGQSSSLTSEGSMDVLAYGQVRVGDFRFPWDPIEDSKLSRVNLYLKAVSGMDGLQTLVLAREKVLTLGGSCLFCWMTMKTDSGHGWEDCEDLVGRSGLNKEVMKSWAAALRRTKKWYRRHFLCFLPLSRPFHPSQFPFQKPCVNGDVVRDVVRIGLEVDDLRLLVARQSSIHRGMREEQMADLLTVQIDGDVGVMLIRLFIDFVLFTWLRREASRKLT